MYETTAVVPVKSKSERVPSKNFRHFSSGRSLLEIKLDQLEKSNHVRQVIVSSDSDLSELSSQYKKVKAVLRPTEFCNNVTAWHLVIRNVLDSLDNPDSSLILWSHVTSPFFSRFDEFIETFLENEQSGTDSLFAATKIDEFIVDEKCRPLNYQWGPWHPYSQDLAPLYSVAGSAFCFRLGVGKEHSYVIGRRPKYFETTDEEGIDIDTELDYKLAQAIWNTEK